MNQELLTKLQRLELRTKQGISESDWKNLSQLPSDYVDFMSMYDGGTGFINDNNNYLDLWPLENVYKLNPYFPEEDFSNQVIVIGSNGSGTLYGYDLLDKCFFETDEYQMSRTEVIKCGNTFFELIEYLRVKQD